MKNISPVVAVWLLAASMASAATTQKWTSGWDNFNEPLNYKKSKVTWSVNASTKKLSVTYTLVGAWLSSAPRLPAPSASFPFKASPAATTAKWLLARVSQRAQCMRRWASSPPTSTAMALSGLSSVLSLRVPMTLSSARSMERGAP